MALSSMLCINRLHAAADDLLTAEIAGKPWDGPLQTLATAAGASHVALLHCRTRGKAASGRSSPGFTAILRECLEGRAPPNSRQQRVAHKFSPGFRIDHEDYSSSELERDPFYQDFLRPHGLFWNANALLALESNRDLKISFKRDLRSGPYEAGDKAILDAILAKLRLVISCSRGVLDAEGTGAARMLHERGDPVFEFDCQGRIRRTHGFSDHAEQPVHIVEGRLVAAERRFAAQLDHAVAATTTGARQASTVTLACASGRQYALQIIPLRGDARDLFMSSIAVGVLFPVAPRRRRIDTLSKMTCDIFGFTDRELQVATLLADGLDIGTIATTLSITSGTARIHLKRIFAKSDTRRQAELVALLAPLHL